DARLTQVAEALFKIASLDFDHSLECRGDGTVLDAVVGCINMLAEELRATLAERARLYNDLEDRVHARTAELAASLDRYRSLVEATHVIPWETEADLTVSYLAPQAATLLGVTLDVTSQKNLEAELRQAQKLEAIGRLAAGIAHEINTPIQFVGDNLSFLAQSSGSLLTLYGNVRALLTNEQVAHVCEL